MGRQKMHGNAIWIFLAFFNVFFSVGFIFHYAMLWPGGLDKIGGGQVHFFPAVTERFPVPILVRGEKYNSDLICWGDCG